MRRLACCVMLCIVVGCAPSPDGGESDPGASTPQQSPDASSAPASPASPSTQPSVSPSADAVPPPPVDDAKEAGRIEFSTSSGTPTTDRVIGPQEVDGHQVSVTAYCQGSVDSITMNLKLGGREEPETATVMSQEVECNKDPQTFTAMYEVAVEPGPAFLSFEKTDGVTSAWAVANRGS